MNPGLISIALVDDSTQLRKFLRNFLPTQGFSIYSESSNGQELLASIQAARSSRPDVCLLDINMPVMDGYETTKQLKALYPSVRVLAYSFFDDKKRRDKIMSCGADGFICKDASSDELVNALMHILSPTRIDRLKEIVHLEAA